MDAIHKASTNVSSYKLNLKSIFTRFDTSGDGFLSVSLTYSHKLFLTNPTIIIYINIFIHMLTITPTLTMTMKKTILATIIHPFSCSHLLAGRDGESVFQHGGRAGR